MFIGTQYWKDGEKLLNKLSWREFLKAYFLYPAIQLYLLIGIIFAGLSIFWVGNLWPIIISAGGCLIIYPLVWYLLHRYLLHGKFLYKSSLTAALWKRIHYDHHRDPNDLSVLFAALYTTLPTIFIIAAPLGWLVIGGPEGSAGALAAAFWYTCFYEFCHCVQHLNYTPKFNFLRTIKKLHLAHHFHNEHGNYGITSFFLDRILGTYYADTKNVPLSPTVFNFGYTGEEVRRFPWVAELSRMPIDEASTQTTSSETLIS